MCAGRARCSLPRTGFTEQSTGRGFSCERSDYKYVPDNRRERWQLQEFKSYKTQLADMNGND